MDFVNTLTIKLACINRGKKLEGYVRNNMLTRVEGVILSLHTQRIENEIISPRDRDGLFIKSKRYAELIGNYKK